RCWSSPATPTAKRTVTARPPTRARWPTCSTRRRPAPPRGWRPDDLTEGVHGERAKEAPPCAVPRGGQRRSSLARPDGLLHHGRAPLPRDLFPVLQGDLQAVGPRPQDQGA